MIKYQVKERLSQYLKEINLSVNALERFCGFSGRYFTKANWNLPEKKIDQIISVLPNLNKDWLLTGNGEMKNGGEDIVLNNFVPIDDIKKQAEFNAETRLEIMNRLLEILKKEGISSPREFEKMIHTMRGVWDNALKRGTRKAIFSWVDCVISMFPGYSYDWAIYGTGPMMIQKSYLPLFEFDGKNIEANRIGDYSIPAFPHADGLYISPCNSLDGTIHTGDILIGKRVKGPIDLSRQYIVATRDEIFVSRIEMDGELSLVNNDGKKVYTPENNDIVCLMKIIGHIRKI